MLPEPVVAVPAASSAQAVSEERTSRPAAARAAYRAFLRMAVHVLVKEDTLHTRLESYAALRRTVERVGGGRGIAVQEQVDRIFSALRTTPALASPGLPSGHSEPTTELICRVLHRADHPLSAHEVAAETGLSRSTAQRYLRRLEQSGRLRLSLRYGDTGRPEHRYAWVAP